MVGWGCLQLQSPHVLVPAPSTGGTFPVSLTSPDYPFSTCLLNTCYVPVIAVGGWSMWGNEEDACGVGDGARIRFHTHGCQGPGSIDLIEASVRRVIVSRADAPEGDTHTTKGNAQWENCTFLVHAHGHDLIRHFSFVFQQCVTSLMLSLLVSSLYSEPGWWVIFSSFHRKTKKQKQANKTNGGNKRKELDEVSVAWAPLLRILWKPVDSWNMVKWPPEFTSGMN